MCRSHPGADMEGSELCMSLGAPPVHTPLDIMPVLDSVMPILKHITKYTVGESYPSWLPGVLLPSAFEC